MTAIITDKIKKMFAQQLFDENTGLNIGDSDNYYYLAVGRSQEWQPSLNTDVSPDPSNTEREERQFRYNMQSVKAIESFSFVVPLKDWTANTVYSAYNDNVAGQPAVSYYIRTADNNVYVCLRTGKNATGQTQVSTVKPDHTSISLPILSDGYVWKYLYTISTADANKFLSTEFMPVKYVDSAAGTDPYFGQYTVQNAAVPGEIIGYRVTNKGGVYSAPPALTIVGNGKYATARAILNSTGGIEAVEVDDSNGAGAKASDLPYASNTYLNTRNGTTPAGGYGFGQGYDYANVLISDATLAAGGTAAEIVPIFAPKLGVGGDARDDLRSTSIMFNVKPEGTVDNTWIVDNDYRQVGLLKNITQYDSTAAFTGTSGIALSRMTLTSKPGDGDPTNGYGINFGNSIEITGADSNAKGWLDFYDDSSTLWYHQDEYTGFTPFRNGETITVEGYSASVLTLDSSNIAPDVDKFSGDLLFINNFGKVSRDRAQTEDIKLVIKL